MTCSLCGVPHPEPEVPWFCWLAANDVKYQSAWGLAITAPAERPTPTAGLVNYSDGTASPSMMLKERRSGECIYFGGPTGESRECPSCAGRVELKLFACRLFGECTPGKPVGDGTACCVTCPEFRVESPSRP
jgi:hypothetical protein